MRIVQFDEAPGIPRVGVMVDDGTVQPVRVPDGTPSDTAVVALAMGDLPPEPEGPPVAWRSVRPRPPIRRPPALRDFMLFEDHLANALRPRGRSVPEAWYAAPAFYFGNPHTVCGDRTGVPVPAGAWADYELELGVVVGRELRDAGPDEAAEAIAGFTLLNDLSLRDRQRAEHPIGLGPSKSKDFGTVLGPALVTPDELPGTRRRPELVLEAWVNGSRWSTGDCAAMHFDLGEALSHASRGSCVGAGDVAGSGTVPTGCVIELLALEREGARWLTGGDVVELRAAGLGTLTTYIT